MIRQRSQTTTLLTQVTQRQEQRFDSYSEAIAQLVELTNRNTQTLTQYNEAIANIITDMSVYFFNSDSHDTRPIRQTRSN